MDIYFFRLGHDIDATFLLNDDVVLACVRNRMELACVGNRMEILLARQLFLA